MAENRNKKETSKTKKHITHIQIEVNYTIAYCGEIESKSLIQKNNLSDEEVLYESTNLMK